MPRITSNRFRWSPLSLAIACTLPLAATAATTIEQENSKKHTTDTMVVTATGNERSSFEAPMMVTVGRALSVGGAIRGIVVSPQRVARSVRRILNLHCLSAIFAMFEQDSTTNVTFLWLKATPWH